MKELYSHPGIFLHKHLKKVSDNVGQFCDELNIDKKFCETAQLAAITHDLGKSTKYFQEHLKGKKVNPSLSSHALLSAVLSVWHFGKDLPVDLKLALFIAVRAHHSNLTYVENLIYPKHEWKYLEEQVKAIDLKLFGSLIKSLGLSSMDNNLLPNFENFKSNFSWIVDDFPKNTSLYFTTNLLLGMLVDADIRAVAGIEVNSEPYEIPDDVVDKYIGTLPKTSPLTPLRKEFYTTVIENIGKFGPETEFLSLTAPTGIGKTLAGFSAAVRLRNMLKGESKRPPRIIYVLPFTSIIDQNFEVISKVLRHYGIPDDILLKHHHRASVDGTNENSGIKDIWQLLEEGELLKEPQSEELLKRYEKAYTRMETWDGEIIVTTFVRFFDTIFTNRRSEMRRLHRLAGSIVILDEVQNIPVEYWEATEKASDFMARQWHTRFILMTATRPALLEGAKELTKPHKEFFFSKLSRTELNSDHEPVPYTEIDKWLVPKVETARSFMVVMNTVRSAQEVYRSLAEELKDFESYFLSASLIPVHREKRIKEIKEKLNANEKVALVATQVVEAGVDLDFEVVIRDFAPLDSIIQAAGRCNRNSFVKQGGKVFLVKLTTPEYGDRRLATFIYDGVLLNTTEEIIGNSLTLKEKEYLKLVEKYFDKLRNGNRIPQNTKLFADIEAMNYDEIAMFSLIKNPVPQVPVFVEFDEKASKIVEILKELDEKRSGSYSERMKRRNLFKSISPKIWGYTINLPAKTVLEVGLPQLPYLSNFLYLLKSYPLDKVYKEDVGFLRVIEHEAIFL